MIKLLYKERFLVRMKYFHLVPVVDIVCFKNKGTVMKNVKMIIMYTEPEQNSTYK